MVRFWIEFQHGANRILLMACMWYVREKEKLKIILKILASVTGRMQLPFVEMEKPGLGAWFGEHQEFGLRTC